MRTISTCATPSVNQAAPHTTLWRKEFTAFSMPSPTKDIVVTFEHYINCSCLDHDADAVGLTR
ncbi:hypothetical protein CUR178_05436 [Leishmania enriettii]|uniref:Uncharacterized protein n=1 Tax=Leishmania enriettii TaxID=5663 RepID=A0A836HJ31_LEIEN|nr:hypothetical protein CUR178_05436 [Leishmania enriettii]